MQGVLYLEESEREPRANTKGAKTSQMNQLTIPAFIPDVLQEHRFKQLPHCTACGRKFTEKEFSVLQQNGYNCVWDIEYAICPSCASEVQGWRRDVQAWRRR